ncbi:MAG: RsmB/NOP family class I SAM-dependent RNA methyltransferase [Clostridia bacterium]|nr:RsmB/NOP family class I SAM-dependent RNA methyltransferase [Clostridia bacterium]
MIPVVPDTLRGMLLHQYGEALTDEIISGFVSHPCTLRANPLKHSIDEVKAALTDAAIPFEEVSWYSDALILPRGTEQDVQNLPIYNQGGLYIQGLSAMLPPLVLGAVPNETILDMAAAPGGKTTQLFSLSGGKALITACEKNKIRAERLRYNLDKQGASRVGIMQQDARTLDDFFSFDKVMLDAPCTGSGTLILEEGQPQRTMTKDWVAKTVKTQKAMLRKALKLLKKGHEMVYSTCSILQCENEGVLNEVLKETGAKIVPIDQPLMEALPSLPVTIPGTLCVKPTNLAEGFFVAKIRK